jgi:ABC-2 type transport system permease protein
MMLWYKAWRESRIRFVLSALALIGICLFIIFFQDENRGGDDERISFFKYIWTFAYDTYAKDLFLASTLLLGLGGLLRERTNGTADFTLALPVGRLELVTVRAAMGLLQMAALALLPVVFIPTLSQLAHESYPFSQALQFSILWIGSGTIWFATGFLLSTFLSGEYTAPAACLVVLIGYFAVVNLRAVEAFPFLNLDKIMSGDDMPYFRESTHQLIGPLPWTPLLVITLIALGILVIAARITQQQDF